MRLCGKLFDWSDSLFRSQQDLVKRAGHAVCLTEFPPARLDYLVFVNRLLQTFCDLDICCALVKLTLPISLVFSVCIRRASVN